SAAPDRTRSRRADGRAAWAYRSSAERQKCRAVGGEQGEIIAIDLPAGTLAQSVVEGLLLLVDRRGAGLLGGDGGAEADGIAVDLCLSEPRIAAARAAGAKIVADGERGYGTRQDGRAADRGRVPDGIQDGGCGRCRRLDARAGTRLGRADEIGDDDDRLGGRERIDRIGLEIAEQQSGVVADRGDERIAVVGQDDGVVEGQGEGEGHLALADGCFDVEAGRQAWERLV